MDVFSREELTRIVREALAEDVGPGDATSLAVVPASLWATALMVAREPLVLAGMELVQLAFRQLYPGVQLLPKFFDGEFVPAGRPILEILGPAQALLTAERVALNFTQRLSGIATLTRHFVEAVAGTKARILDTRKTTPGWRKLEKYAVVCGGGQNHRFGLYDLILIKDNHLAALKNELPNPVAAAVRKARSQYPDLRVEVEADTFEQAAQAVEAGADIILLDNMDLATLRKCVEFISGRAQTEASGGVNLQTVRAIAETGVDFISVGALTHSARAVDIALDFKA